MKKALLFLGIVLVLTSCDEFKAKPVPEKYASLIGTWEGSGIDLVITADGGISYKKISGSGSSEMTAPIKEMTDDHILIKVLFIRQELKINKLPYSENNQKKVRIDGNVLVKKEY